MCLVPTAWAATAPSAPRNLQGVPGDMQLNIGWTVPVSDGGSPITGYHIVVTGDLAPIVVDIGPLTVVSIPVTVRGGHSATAAAVNAVGTGPVGTLNSVNIITAPTAPRNLVVLPGDTSAFVSFTPPADNGGALIQGCTATASPGGLFGNSPSTIPITIFGLTNGIGYTVAVFCYTSNTTGTPLQKYSLNGAVATAPIVQPGVASPPVGVSAVAGNQQATVSWTPLPNTDRTGYVITPYIGGTAQAPVPVGGSASSYPVSGLANGVTYTFKVQVVNPAGTGAQSAPSNPVTTNSLPDPPTAPSATAGFTQATVSWTPPAFDGGSPLTGYVVTPYLGAVAQTPVAVGLVTSAPISGLNHASYTFTVSATNAVGAGLPSVASNAVVPTAPPGAPTTATALPGKQSAAVSWVAPVADGGAAIVSYTATSIPGGLQCTWTTGPLGCVVSGLDTGTSYTFTVVGNNGLGDSVPSGPSTAVVPWSGSAFHNGGPTRILDSRTSAGGWGSKLSAASARELTVVGVSAVALDATAVVVNITVTNGDQGSFVTVWPSGTTKPNVSNVNFPAGTTIANFATVKVGTGGNLSFANEIGSVDVVVDLVGYYDDGIGDLHNTIAPSRYLDSRTSTGGWGGHLSAGTPRDLAVRGPGLLPLTATSVIANVTVTNSSTGSYLSVWPSTTAQPLSSSINFGTYQTISNLMTVPVGANGALSFANALGTVDVIVDVVGFFDSSSGGRFHAVSPARMLDDRYGTGLTGFWGQGQTRTLLVGSVSPIPSDATAIIVNVTATNAPNGIGSYLKIFPTGTPEPASSSVNFAPYQTIANGVIVAVGAGGGIEFYNELLTVDIIADATGYFAAV